MSRDDIGILTFIVCVALLAIWIHNGYSPHAVEYSETLVESGEVYDTAFIPPGHGELDLDIPARFAVIFRCAHGKFTVTGVKGEELYGRLTKGDKVLITYREIIRMGTRNGRPVRTVIDLDFLNAGVIVDKRRGD